MSNKLQFSTYTKYAPFLVFVAGLCFITSLLFTIKKDAFFSGDAGLKYLMVKQISHGGSYYTIDLNSTAWVKEIWSQGFYPLKSPFVYDSPRGKIVSFPPAFQVISSKLYKWFGFPGLYLVTCLSVPALWLSFIVLLRRAGLRESDIAVGLLLLVFCSPLTVYAALYWEHTLSTFLMFNAVAFLVKPPASPVVAAAMGLLAGMSVWLRPEMLLLCGLIFIVLAFNNYGKHSFTNIVFIVSALSGVIAFFLFNASVYGNILGAHSYQLLENERVTMGRENRSAVLVHINARLLIYFPFILFTLLPVAYLTKRKWLPTASWQLSMIVIIFSLTAPFFLPNAGGKQWGPRYFLPLIPTVLTIFCLTIAGLKISLLKNRILLALLIPVVVYSLYVNVYLAYNTVRDDYAFRVKPGLNYLKGIPGDILVVQNQYITQEFAAITNQKKVFLAEDTNSFEKLGILLKSAGVQRIIYMASDRDHIMRPQNLITGNRSMKQTGGYYFAVYELK